MTYNLPIQRNNSTYMANNSRISPLEYDRNINPSSPKYSPTPPYNQRANTYDSRASSYDSRVNSHYPIAASHNPASYDTQSIRSNNPDNKPPKKDLDEISLTEICSKCRKPRPKDGFCPRCGSL